jgi:hypothetical protein
MSDVLSYRVRTARRAVGLACVVALTSCSHANVHRDTRAGVSLSASFPEGWRLATASLGVIAVDGSSSERVMRLSSSGSAPVTLERTLSWSSPGGRLVMLSLDAATEEPDGVSAFAYLTDVLIRVHRHPARDALGLAPKAWKQQLQHRDAAQLAAAVPA